MAPNRGDSAVRTALLCIAALTLASCQSEPKIVGEEATRVLEQCIMADTLTIMDNETRRSNGGVYTPEMVDRIDDAIATCRLVGRIDKSQVSVSVRPCLDVYAIKADVYEAAKPIVLDGTATEAEKATLNKHLDRMSRAQRQCESPAPTHIA